MTIEFLELDKFLKIFFSSVMLEFSLCLIHIFLFHLTRIQVDIQ